MLVALSLVGALIGFAVLVDTLFVRLEVLQIETAIEREARRAADRFMASEVGTQLLDDVSGGLSVQFVDRNGTVVLPSETGAVLPLHREPTRATGVQGRSWIVTSVPWILPSGLELGTVRVGQDLASITDARATLIRALATGGAAIAAVTVAIALWLLGRSLAPLRQLVREAEAIDPARPELRTRLATDARRDEVGTLARALTGAMDGIRRRQQHERDALAEVAHELAAPLSVVAGRLRGVEARDPSPEIRAAREAADELLHTSRDLLSVARGELEWVIEYEVVDLAELVRGVVAETPFVQADAPEAVEVLGSAERLRQAVRNLIRNALAADGNPADVNASVACEGDEAVVRIRDRGSGLPVGEEARVFERHRSRRSGGTGLGLSVASTIVAAHEGTLTARNRSRGGAVFELRVPTLTSRLEADSDDETVSKAAHEGTTTS